MANLAEHSEEGYGSERDDLQMVMIIVHIKRLEL
jgi:hypothetical protein